ncbi:MAG TPA: hypothetical protein EYG88_08160 [Desulfocapsa sulfexigens]|nr:hypothetical protein [Desulfocapsa sulfexigens]
MRLVVFFAVYLFFTGAVFASQGESAIGCAELLQKRCQSCHYLSRVCIKVGKYSKRRWKATLKRMVKRRGATLNKEELKLLTECLALPSSEVKKECEK